MLKVYYYPKIDYKSILSPNAYIYHLEQSVAGKAAIVNQYHHKTGVLDFFINIFKADVYLFNWIENLSFKKYGKLQTVAFTVFLFCARLLKRKIIWILHNKYTHDRAANKWTNYLFRLMMKHADIIFTHSLSGIDFVKEVYPRAAAKVRYVMHPILPPFPKSNSEEKKYDFLIWGTIYPYKGVVDFLKFITGAGMPGIRVLIAGRCFDQELKKEISKYLSANIILLDQFFEIEEIAKFASQSKFIVFNYKATSVLSSGALMDSIRMGTPIIASNIGAFRDLNSYSFIKTFDHYEQILAIYKNYQPGENAATREMDAFYFENSWDKFGDSIAAELNKLNSGRKEY